MAVCEQILSPMFGHNGGYRTVEVYAGKDNGGRLSSKKMKGGSDEVPSLFR